MADSVFSARCSEIMLHVKIKDISIELLVRPNCILWDTATR